MNKADLLASMNIERFWSNICRTDECWEWTAFRDRAGYGQYNVRLPGRKKRPYGAHKIAHVLTNGDVPQGMNVLHRCDNPPCCNPNHLFLGTHHENMTDAARKGRTASMARRKVHVCGHPWDGSHNYCVPCQQLVARRSRRKKQAVNAVKRSHAITVFIPDQLPASFEALVGLVGIRRATITSRHFGLYGRTSETLQSIGDSLGVTRERIRQIVNRVAGDYLGAPVPTQSNRRPVSSGLASAK